MNAEVKNAPGVALAVVEHTPYFNDKAKVQACEDYLLSIYKLELGDNIGTSIFQDVIKFDVDQIISPVGLFKTLKKIKGEGESHNNDIRDLSIVIREKIAALNINKYICDLLPDVSEGNVIDLNLASVDSGGETDAKSNNHLDIDLGDKY